MGGNNDPFSLRLPSIAADHERCDLISQTNVGEIIINVAAPNLSNYGNIFLRVIQVTSINGIDVPPGNVPEPTTLAPLVSHWLAWASNFCALHAVGPPVGPIKPLPI